MLSWDAYKYRKVEKIYRTCYSSVLKRTMFLSLLNTWTNFKVLMQNLIPLENSFYTSFYLFSGEADRTIAFGQLRRFSWRELQLATNNFSEKNVLG